MPGVGVMGNNAAWDQIRHGQLETHGAERGDSANTLLATRDDQTMHR